MRTVLAPRASSILYDLLAEPARPRGFLLPANICPIVPLTFFKAGVPVEFVDIAADTLQMDLGQAVHKLGQDPAAYGGVLYAHTYGDAYSPDDLFHEIKNRFPQILLIDDRCLCMPDLDPPASSPADVILYSTGYAKIVDIGMGGYAYLQDGVTCRHRSLPYERAALRAAEDKYKACIASGTEFVYEDSDWLQTDGSLPAWEAYRRKLMKVLPASLEHRQSINAVYNSHIPAEVQLPARFQLWRYNLRLKQQKRVLDALFAVGLFASAHYAALDGIMGAGSGRNARELAGQVINLVNDRHYTIEMAEKTAKIVLRSL